MCLLPGYGRCCWSTGGSGGGIGNIRENLTLINSTVSGNTAGDDGGGVYNTFGPLSLSRSLLSGNTASNGPEVFSFGATVTANNSNLFGLNDMAGVVDFSPGINDIVPSDPTLATILSPLGNNGGPTQTYTLPVGSPAIDEAEGCPPPVTDQRLAPRAVDVDNIPGALCDIGAYEFNSVPPAICGNSILELGETCDDDNTIAGDGCSATCQLEVCGNGLREGSEHCDPGLPVAGDYCTASCTFEGAGSSCSTDNTPCTRDVCNSTGQYTHPPALPILPGKVFRLGAGVRCSYRKEPE